MTKYKCDYCNKPRPDRKLYRKGWIKFSCSIGWHPNVGKTENNVGYLVCIVCPKCDEIQMNKIHELCG